MHHAIHRTNDGVEKDGSSSSSRGGSGISRGGSGSSSPAPMLGARKGKKAEKKSAQLLEVRERRRNRDRDMAGLEANAIMKGKRVAKESSSSTTTTSSSSSSSHVDGELKEEEEEEGKQEVEGLPPTKVSSRKEAASSSGGSRDLGKEGDGGGGMTPMHAGMSATGEWKDGARAKGETKGGKKSEMVSPEQIGHGVSIETEFQGLNPMQSSAVARVHTRTFAL